MKILLLLSLFWCSAAPFAAVEYHDFNQPEQEQIYLSLVTELRCLVCQNQTIADSNADLAKDLRRQVYEMVQKGQSKQEIVNFMTDRYGDFVLYRPAFNVKTALLWLGPVAFLLTGLVTVIIMVKRRNKNLAETTIDPAAQHQAQTLLEEGNDE